MEMIVGRFGSVLSLQMRIVLALIYQFPSKRSAASSSDSSNLQIQLQVRVSLKNVFDYGAPALVYASPTSVRLEFIEVNFHKFSSFWRPFKM
jgi:hypothetical protein